MYQVKIYIEPSGQRNSVLVDRDTGIPDHYSTLFVTNQLRAKDLAASSKSKYLQHISILFCWANLREIDLVERIRSGEYFAHHEIDSLASMLRLEGNEMDGYISDARAKKGVIDIRTKKLRSFWDSIDSISTQVSPHNYNTKIRMICTYMLWLSSILSDEGQRKPSITRETVQKVGEKFDALLSAKKVVEPSGYFKADKSLTNAQIKRIFDVVRTESPENPFDNEAVRVRNLAIIMTLIDGGLRSAELLNLRITDISRPTKKKVAGLKVIRRQGSIDDSRIKQPNPKTPQSEREVPLENPTLKAIDLYITEYRNKLDSSENTPYLFLSHHNNPRYRGKPIARINDITNAIRDVTGIYLTPHIFRHTATWRYCVNQKKMGRKWENFVETLILKFGWKNADSPSVRLYAKKYLRDELFSKDLQQQDQIGLGINLASHSIGKQQ